MRVLVDLKLAHVVEHFPAGLAHVAATALDRSRLLKMNLEAVVADQAQVAVVRC